MVRGIRDVCLSFFFVGFATGDSFAFSSMPPPVSEQFGQADTVVIAHVVSIAEILAEPEPAPSPTTDSNGIVTVTSPASPRWADRIQNSQIQILEVFKPHRELAPGETRTLTTYRCPGVLCPPMPGVNPNTTYLMFLIEESDKKGSYVPHFGASSLHALSNSNTDLEDMARLLRDHFGAVRAAPVNYPLLRKPSSMSCAFRNYCRSPGTRSKWPHIATPLDEIALAKTSVGAVHRLPQSIQIQRLMVLLCDAQCPCPPHQTSSDRWQSRLGSVGCAPIQTKGTRSTTGMKSASSTPRSTLIWDWADHRSEVCPKRTMHTYGDPMLPVRNRLPQSNSSSPASRNIVPIGSPPPTESRFRL